MLRCFSLQPKSIQESSSPTFTRSWWVWHMQSILLNHLLPIMVHPVVPHQGYGVGVGNLRLVCLGKLEVSGCSWFSMTKTWLQRIWIWLLWHFFTSSVGFCCAWSYDFGSFFVYPLLQILEPYNNSPPFRKSSCRNAFRQSGQTLCRCINACDAPPAAVS